MRLLDAASKETVVRCDESQLSGALDAPGAITGLLEGASFGACQHVTSGKGVTMTLPNLPHGLEFDYLGLTAPEGSLALTASGAKAIELKFITQDKQETECLYGAASEPVTASVHNGAAGGPSTLVLEGVQLEEQEPKELLCEDDVLLDVTYELGGKEGEEAVDLFVARE